MKVSREPGPFIPITITVETEEEHRALSWLLWHNVVLEPLGSDGGTAQRVLRDLRSKFCVL